nr:putative mfs-type transporter [Quercus suber]
MVLKDAGRVPEAQVELTNPDKEGSSDLEERNYTLEQTLTFQTTYEQAVEGALYHDGQLVKQPAATRDPKDPLNLSTTRKIIGVFSLSFFGALIASAELILGAALPVFVLEYANPPQSAQILESISEQGGFTLGSNPIAYLNFFNGPPIFDIYLLATLPLLVIGVSNLFLVPLAISIGRRPVIIITGLLAIAGAAWAGNSHSLGSHIGARCIQAIGAGSVESLIPFIIQDIVHVHERNTWISSAFAAQGVIIIAIGFSAPYLIVNVSWRWLYFVTAIAASFFLLCVIFFLPETRWNRTRAEMNGVPRDDENVHYTPRTWWYDWMVFHGTVEWKKGGWAIWDTLKTFFYPQIFFVTMLNGAVISSAFAAGFTVAPALLTMPWSWPFKHLGLCLIPVLIGAILVAGITGGAADWLANHVARKRGSRVPENQLINLILPAIASILGALLFGLAGGDQQKYSWGTFLFGLGCMAFGFLGTSSVTTVYVLESYPHIAGPALVNVASFRFIIAFLLTFDNPNWIVELGYLKTYMIYLAVIAGFSCLIPIVYIWGPAWKKRFPANPRSATH